MPSTQKRVTDGKLKVPMCHLSYEINILSTAEMDGYLFTKHKNG